MADVAVCSYLGYFLGPCLDGCEEAFVGQSRTYVRYVWDVLGLPCLLELTHPPSENVQYQQASCMRDSLEPSRGFIGIERICWETSFAFQFPCVLLQFGTVSNFVANVRMLQHSTQISFDIAESRLVFPDLKLHILSVSYFTNVI